MTDRPIHPPSEDLFAYRDGELSPEKRALIEAHVSGCSTCRSMIDQVSSLEAELRQSPDHAPAQYLETLHEAVRQRIVTSGAMRGLEEEEEEAAVGQVEVRPGVGRDRRTKSRGGRERRGSGRPFSTDVRVKDEPKLPWAAVLSTASAAAAVLVVVVILMRHGVDTGPQLPRANEPGRSISEAPSLGTKTDRDAKSRAARKKGAQEEKQLAEKGALNRTEAYEKPGDQAALGKVTEDNLESEARAQREEASTPAPEEKLKDQARSAPSALAPSVPEVRQSSPFTALVQRLGIPPVWDEAQVTPEALQRAEPELRALYVSGGAGQDSANIRLYLAEAVRARYAPGDSVAYDEIVHHYKRAIALAKDPKTASVAAERLQTLQK